MKSRVVVCAWSLVVVFSAGNRFNLDLDTGLPASEEGVREEVAPFFLGGLVASPMEKTWSRCAYGVARVETRVSPADLAATALTAAIYAPRTVRVTCVAGPVEPEPARPAVSADTTSVLGAWTMYSDEGLAWKLGDDGEVSGEGRAIQSVMIRSGGTMRDGWVETTTAHADDGGLVLRFQDNLNYYLLAIRDDASPWPRGQENLKIYKRVHGSYLELWSADVEWKRGDTRRVRFEARGDRLHVYLDDAPLATVIDEMPFPAGGFGLRHYGGSEAWTNRFASFAWGGR